MCSFVTQCVKTAKINLNLDNSTKRSVLTYSSEDWTSAINVLPGTGHLLSTRVVMRVSLFWDSSLVLLAARIQQHCVAGWHILPVSASVYTQHSFVGMSLSILSIA